MIFIENVIYNLNLPIFEIYENRLKNFWNFNLVETDRTNYEYSTVLLVNHYRFKMLDWRLTHNVSEPGR